MQVIHPYPAVVKPSLSSSLDKFDFYKYSVTTPDPGERLVLIYGLILSPFTLAFFATSPAAIITSGLEVFVHDVMAAKTTDPCFKMCS